MEKMTEPVHRLLLEGADVVLAVAPLPLVVDLGLREAVLDDLRVVLSHGDSSTLIHPLALGQRAVRGGMGRFGSVAIAAGWGLRRGRSEAIAQHARVEQRGGCDAPHGNDTRPV